MRHARPDREEHVEGAGTTADPPLSELGRRQAIVTAEFLLAEAVDHVASSTMRRAIETAAPLAAELGLEIESLDELREVDDGNLRYIPAEEMTLDDPVAARFLEDPMTIFNGDYEGFRSRVVRGFEHLIATNKGRTVAVFCHGMVMSVYLQTLMGHDDPYRLSPDYCGIMRVSASSTGIRTPKSANETAHLRGISV